MTPDIDLGKLSHAGKDALIRSLLPLVGQLQAALARIAELEARLAKLERPAKTPDNSSLPHRAAAGAARRDAGAAVRWTLRLLRRTGRGTRTGRA